MNIWEEFGTDEDLENEGVWLWLDSEQTVGVKVARYGGHNKRWEKELDKVSRNGGRVRRSPAELRELELRAFVRGCVLDWKGITTPDGQPVPFSHDAALNVFRKLPDLTSKVREFASDQAEFKAARLEEESKNS